MLGYRARLEKDLERWQQAGHVTVAGAAAIRGDLDNRPSRLGLAPVLSILGATLIAFGAMTFVASNWADMPKFLRLLILAGGIWASYGVAYALFRQEMGAFAQAAVLLGCGIYGASIMLISQMYHIEGNPPDAVLMWAVGTGIAGALLGSNPAYALTAALVGLWSGWETGLIDGPHWMFVPVWLLLSAAMLFTTSWRPAIHLMGLLLAGWVVTLGYVLPGHRQHHWVALIGLGVAAFSFVMPRLGNRLAALAGPTLGYGVSVAFAGLWAFQFAVNFPKPSVGALILGAILALLFVLAVIAYGLRTENRSLLWLGYTGFSIEIVSIYFRTMGTLLNTSLFFLSAGVLLIGLASIAWQLHKRNLAGAGAQT